MKPKPFFELNLEQRTKQTHSCTEIDMGVRTEAVAASRMHSQRANFKKKTDARAAATR
jgi:hypothetical protein